MEKIKKIGVSLCAELPGKSTRWASFFGPTFPTKPMPILAVLPLRPFSIYTIEKKTESSGIQDI